MALFGGSKSTKKFDVKALRGVLDTGSNKQSKIIGDAFAQTPELLKTFEKRRSALGQSFEQGANQRAQQFSQGLQNLESPELVRQQQAKATELAFRNLPAAQQNIREQLAATGGLNRGVAIRALQAPTLQAAQQASDQGFQIEQAAAGRDLDRQQQALSTIFQTGQGAALQKLGIDEQTANVLLQTGRSDILDRAFKLAGIEEGRTQGLLDLEQLRQTQDIAAAQAKQQQRAGTFGTIGSIGGGVIGGIFGGPLGASAGASLGGQLGGAAAGSNKPVDLSGSLAALALRRRQQPQFSQNQQIANELARRKQTLNAPIF